MIKIKKAQNTLDIILVMAPSWGSNMPPLGLSYVNSSLLAKGYRSDLFDMNIDLFSKVEERYKELWSFEKHPLWVEPNKFGYIKEVFHSYIENYTNYLLEISPVVLAFSVNAGNRLFTLELLKRIRRRGEGGPFILIGGPLSRMDRNHQFILPDLADYIDSAVIGEGEEITGNIINKVKSPRHSQINKFIQAEQIQDLDSLPFPQYKREDLNKYTENIIPLLMSRGCLGRCSFCDARFFQPGFRIRSPENVLEEIKYHLRTTGIRNFTFNDLAINWDLKKLERLCELIIEENLDIVWNASATIRKGMSLDLFKKIEKAGCSPRGEANIFGVKGGSLVFGLESGSDTILRAMNKNYTSEIAADILEKSAHAGITNLVNIIVGFPGEKMEHLQATINFIKNNRANISRVATLSLAYVPQLSELGQNPDKFRIKFPKNDPVFKWYSSDGNNLNERRRRAEKVKESLKEINLLPLATTFSYGQQDTQNSKETEKSPKKIILVMAPPWEVDAPPLGLAYLENYLKTRRIEAYIVDGNLTAFNSVSEQARKLWGYAYIDKWNDELFFNKIKNNELTGVIQKIKEQILDIDSSLIGFSVNQVNRIFVKELIKEVKKEDPERKIILGGPGVFHERERKSLTEIKNLVYAWIIGEGEVPLYHLITDYYSGGTNKNIPGVIWKNKDLHCADKAPVKNLNKLPFPSYDGFKMDRYSGKGMIKILGSRGCVGKCKFCNDRVFMFPYRSRSADNIFEEIKFHYYNFSVKHFVFNDLLFNGSVSNIDRLLDLIISSEIEISWDANVVLSSKFFPEKFVEKFQNSGCNMLMVGIESGSNRVLREMGKLFTIEEATLLLRKLHDSGIKIWINIIVGYPGETEEDLNKTINFLLQNRAYIDQVSSLNTCNIPFGSLLMEEKEYYGIHFSEDRGIEVDWWDEKGNNRELRDQRLKKIKRVLHENHIDCMQSNEVCFRNRKNRIEKEKDIFLVMPPPWGVDVPPLSVACLSSHLRKQGFSVEVFDFNIELYNSVPSEYRYLWSMNYGDWWHDQVKYKEIRKDLGVHIEALIIHVVNFPAKIIGFSFPTNCPDLIMEEMVRRIKGKFPEKAIVLGGVSISINEQRNDLLKRIRGLVDYCVLGEGEEVLCKLVKKIKEGKLGEICDLEGVLCKGNFNKTKKKAVFKDWNEVRFPEFKEFALDKYTARGLSLPIEFSRGCIGKCPFCDFRTVFFGLKLKKPALVVDQIKFYLDNYGINHLTVVDPSVNSSIDNLNNVCDLLIERNFNIKLSALAIPRKEMTYELLLKMKKAGFYRLEYGVESGSNKVLRSMRKIFTAQQASKVLENTFKSGIDVYVYLIVGYVNEEKEDFESTKNFIKENASFITMIKSINPLYIMAGSEIFSDPVKFGIILPSIRADREWFTNNGNNYKLRKERVFELKRYVKSINMDFTEEAESGEFSFNGSFDINKFKRQSISIKFILLIFVSAYTFFYIVYFWLFEKIAKKPLLGGKREN